MLTIYIHYIYIGNDYFKSIIRFLDFIWITQICLFWFCLNLLKTDVHQLILELVIKFERCFLIFFETWFFFYNIQIICYLIFFSQSWKIQNSIQFILGLDKYNILFQRYIESLKNEMKKWKRSIKKLLQNEYNIVWIQ